MEWLSSLTVHELENLENGKKGTTAACRHQTATRSSDSSHTIHSNVSAESSRFGSPKCRNGFKGGEAEKGEVVRDPKRKGVRADPCCLRRIIRFCSVLHNLNFGQGKAIHQHAQAKSSQFYGSMPLQKVFCASIRLGS